MPCSLSLSLSLSLHSPQSNHPHLQSQTSRKHLSQAKLLLLNTSTHLHNPLTQASQLLSGLHLFNKNMCQHTHKKAHTPSDHASSKHKLVNHSTVVGWICCHCYTTVQYAYWTCPSTSCGHGHCEDCTWVYASAR